MSLSNETFGVFGFDATTNMELNPLLFALKHDTWKFSDEALAAPLNPEQSLAHYLIVNKILGDVNAKDALGESAIFKVSNDWGHKLLTVLLEDESVDVNIRNFQGLTVLEIAAVRRDQEAVKALLSTGRCDEQGIYVSQDEPWV